MKLQVVAFLLCFAVLVGCTPSGAGGLESPVSTGTTELPTESPVQPSPTLSPPTAQPTPSLVRITVENQAQLSVLHEFALPDVGRSVAFSPDGTLLAASSGNQSGFEVRIWDTRDGSLVNTLQGHTGIIWDVAFSMDGQLLASASADLTVRLWRVSDGAPFYTIQAPGSISSVKFSPDGSYLSLGGVKAYPDAAVWLYDLNTWGLVREFSEYWNIPEILFTPDSQVLIAGGTSRNARAWRVSDGAELYVLNFPGQVNTLALSPDGRTIVAGPCLVSTNYACQSSEIRLLDSADGRVIRKFDSQASSVQGLSFSPDGTLLISASFDSWMRVWGMPAGSLLGTHWASNGSVEDLAFSPDGTRIATVGSDGTVYLWGIVP